MKPYQGSPIPRPCVRETNIDHFSRSSNGDLSRNPYIGVGPARGMLGGLSGSVLGVGGHNGNKRSSIGDVDLEEMATPSDTMLTPMSKLPIPPDDDDDVSQEQERVPPSGVFRKFGVKHGISRKGMSILVCLGLFCIVLQAIVLAMAILWPRETIEDIKVVCLTPDCLRASAELQGNLNLEVEPCQDFWQFSCGGWLRDNPLPNTTSYWSVNEKLKYSALGDIRTLLDTMDSPKDMKTIEWKIQHFYAACMGDGLPLNVATLKRTILSQLGGWNLLKDTWERRTWFFPTVLQKLQVNYGISPFFKVRVVQDPHNEGANIIKLFASGFSMPHKSYYKRLPNNEVANAYQQYIKDTVKIFGVSGPDSVDFASHFYHYESRIAEITPGDDIIDDPLVSNNRVTIGQLSILCSIIPWLDILHQMFPSNRLDHRTEILIVSEEYFSSLSQLISTTPRSDLCNYMIFHFISYHMPYIANEGKRVYNFFKNQFTGAKETPERWQFCMETTRKFFPYGLGSLYERSPRRMKLRYSNIEQVEAMFYRVRATARSNIWSSKWYPQNLKPILDAKLNNMSIIVGYPEELLDVQYIDHYYDNLVVFRNLFANNLQEAITFQRNILNRKLKFPDKEKPWMEALKGDDVTYVYESNKIVVPPHLLNHPFFHPKYPRCLTYGNLGVRITRELLKAFNPIGLSYDSRGLLVERTDITNKTVRHIKNLGECMALTTMSLSVEEDNYVNRTSSDTAAEVDAVRQTYEAYLASLTKDRELHPPSFESLNSTNLFFMSYAGSLCSEMTRQREDIFRTIGSSLMEYPRLLAVLSQMPEFTESFVCIKNTKHYPRKICDSLH